ncbi:MAG TPA: serine/threonine-protein kinase [Candidatus Xenobia bacterium]|jgi:serine/threonine-protein kinase
MLSQGTVLRDRYAIVRVLGQGGHARVYLAQDRKAQTPVAIKALGILKKPTEAERKQFRLEGQLLQTLQHAHLVRVHEIFEEKDDMFLVMDYLEGRSLADKVRSDGAAPAVRSVLQWADPICESLEYLHSQHPPIVIRDLKPANIMLGPGGDIHIIDFGIARALDGTGTILKGAGTPGFAAVELQGSASSDHRADIYSLGATLYALFVGEPPPRALDRAYGDTMEPPRQRNRDIPEALDAVILKMLAVAQANRYASIAEVRAALREVALALPLPAAPKPAGRSWWPFGKK